MYKRLHPIRDAVKRHAPWITPMYRYMYLHFLRRPKWRRMGMTIFAEHYQRNSWGCSESVSGEGSTLDQTAAIRAALPQLIKDFQIQTMLDIPCGDFNWMKLLDLPIQYLGADVVEDIVAENKRRFGNHSRSFTRLDLTGDTLPKVDLIFCRDLIYGSVCAVV